MAPTLTDRRVPPYLVAGLVSLQGLMMYLFAARGAFFADDLMNIAMLRVDFDSKLTMQYLTTPIFGHFTPGLRFMYWVVATAHLDYSTALVLNIVLYIVILLLMERLLRLLFGETWVNLLLLFFFGFSTLWMPETMWWSAGAHFFPTMIFGLLMIDGLFRFIVGGRRRWLLASVAAFAFALLWHEKAMLLIIMVPVMAGMVLARGSSPLAVVRAIARLTMVWALYAVPALLYLYHYFLQSTYQSQPTPTIGGMVTLMAVAWVQGFIPAVLGGPLSWRSTDVGLGLAAAPPAWVMIGGQLVFLGSVAVSLRLRGFGVWRAWALPVIAVALYAGLAGYVRLAIFGTSMGTDYRYVFDACLFMTLALGLAFLPLATSLGGVAAPRRTRRRPERPSARSAAAAAAAVVFTGFIISMSGASVHWAEGEPGRFSRNLKRTVASARPGPDGRRWFFNTLAPERVIPKAFSPYNKASYFLPILVPGAESVLGRVPGYMVGADGSVHPARIAGGARATTNAWTSAGNEHPNGRLPSCAEPASSSHMTTFRLDRALPAGQWFLLITYTGAHNAGVHLAINTGSGDDIDATANFDIQRFPDGDGQYLVDLRVDPVSSVRLDLVPKSALCLVGLEVGRPVPTP